MITVALQSFVGVLATAASGGPPTTTSAWWDSTLTLVTLVAGQVDGVDALGLVPPAGDVERRG